MPRREPTERQRQQRAAASDARNDAVRRLKAAHPDEYREYYEEECRKRGVTPLGDRRELRIRKLKEELARLEAKP